MSVVQTVRTLLADLKEINCRIWVEGGDLMVRTTRSGSLQR